MRTSALGFLILAPSLLVLAACGGDDETPAEADDTPAAAAPADPEPAPAAVADAACPALDVTGTPPSGAEFVATSAVAANISDGAAYTLYLADFDLTLDSFSSLRNPEVPEGGTLWTVAVTIFNAAPEDVVPIEAGTVVEADRPFGELTFTVVAREGETFAGNSTGQAGTLTVDGVGDVFCGSLEYTDGEKSVSGSFQAPTKPI